MVVVVAMLKVTGSVVAGVVVVTAVVVVAGNQPSAYSARMQLQPGVGDRSPDAYDRLRGLPPKTGF